MIKESQYGIFIANNDDIIINFIGIPYDHKKRLRVKFWVIMAIIFELLVLPSIFFAKHNFKENIENKHGDFLEA